MTDYVQKHEGPWPLDPEQPLDCDRCGRTIRQTRDPWLAYANPYGPFGWTLLCGACAAQRTENERRRFTMTLGPDTTTGTPTKSLVYVAHCEVCTRTIQSALRTPLLGTLMFKAGPREQAASYAMCIDCATDLVHWIALRRDYKRVADYRR